MKNLLKTILAPLLATVAITACSDWTDTEPKDATDLSSTNRSEAYYEQLRKYKTTDHQVAFGWFGNWTGTGASLENSLVGLPDSVDFVSLWGNWKNITPDQQRDLKFVQEKKGTKVLICFLVFDIGDQITPPKPTEGEGSELTYEEWRHKFWGWADDEESQLKATEKYANAICDTIDKYGYDGFDLDAEPNIPQPFPTNRELWTNKAVMQKFVTTMAKRIGPASGTKKMFVVDGEPDAFPDSFGPYFDYFILQAYSASSENGLNNRFRRQVTNFNTSLTPEQVAKKIIVCENFESYASSGGVSFTLSDGRRLPSLWGMAYWQPTYNGKTYRKGGVGSYHMEYEYKVSGKSVTYPYLRNAIQIQNPAIF